MELLNFKLPTLARTQFVSLPAKEYWEPKIKLARMAANQLEFLSIIHNLRKCCTVHIKKEEFEDKSKYYLENYGLFLTVIKCIVAFKGFSETHREPKENEKAILFCTLTKNVQDGIDFKNAYNNNNHEEMGKILGYPSCCSKSLMENMHNGYFDSTFQQAEKTNEKYIKSKEETKIRLSYRTPWEINSFLRIIGLRIIPHEPCSNDCEKSLNMAKEWLKLGEELELEGLEDLKFLLQISCEWDALKGIGYITTPIFKIERNSVACYPNYIVQREGKKFPMYAGKGLKFPFVTLL